MKEIKKIKERTLNMLCQNCKEKTASFHYTQNKNGHITEMHLCKDCAQKAGLIDDSHKIWSPFGFAEEETMLDGLLGGLFASPSKSKVIENTVCPFCGMRLGEFMRCGKAGCAKCYTTFKTSVYPSIQKLHGNTKHAGKIPVGRTITKTKEEKRAELEALMSKAVAEQEYEKAAEYRDKIKALDAEEKKED